VGLAALDYQIILIGDDFDHVPAHLVGDGVDEEDHEVLEPIEQSQHFRSP
jgi:hypothetical protein